MFDEEGSTNVVEDDTKGAASSCEALDQEGTMVVLTSTALIGALVFLCLLGGLLGLLGLFLLGLFLLGSLGSLGSLGLLGPLSRVLSELSKWIFFVPTS